MAPDKIYKYLQLKAIKMHGILTSIEYLVIQNSRF